MRHYDIAGDDHPQPIIFLHGTMVTRRWWHPQMAALSDQFRVLAADLPGHGALAQQPFRLQPTLSYLHILIGRECPAQPLLVGISLGGYLAIAYAARFPDRVGGLMLSGCSLNLNGLSGWSFRLTALMLKYRGAAWLEQAQVKSYRKRIAPTLIEPVIEAGLYPQAVPDAFLELSGKNFHRILAGFAGRVLIVNGEQDEANRKAEKSLMKALPRVQTAPIPNAGHLANLEQPEAFNATLRAFAEQYVKRPA